MAQGAEVEQQKKEEHRGGNEGLERCPAHPHVRGSGGASFQGCTKHMCNYMSTQTLPEFEVCFQKQF